MNYELKHIRGIPYYLSGTTLYTFELDATGQPSDLSVAIGNYYPESDSVIYFADWKDRVQSHLDSFRNSLVSLQRDSLRKVIIKPQKQSVSKRNTRKPSARAKSTKSK